MTSICLGINFNLVAIIKDIESNAKILKLSISKNMSYPLVSVITPSVETVVDVFNSTDADIVYGDWVNLYYPSANLELLPWLKLSKYDLLSDYNLPQPTVFIRRNVFEKIGNFNLDYTLVADNEFFTRAALAGFKLVKIEEVLAGQTREHLIYASE